MALKTKYKERSDEEIVHLIMNSGNHELFELIYSRYFKKTPCESFENLLKQRNQKKLEKEKEIEEKQ